MPAALTHLQSAPTPVLVAELELELLKISDGSGLGPGLESPPARPIFARPGPPEARSKKPESPRAFFGPKIGQFSTYFRPNLGKIMEPFVPKNFSLVLGRKLAENRLKIGLFLAHFRPIFSLVQSLKILTMKNSDFICIKPKKMHFILWKSPKKSPKPDVKKPGPARGPKKSGPARPKPDNCRPGTSLLQSQKISCKIIR